MTYSSRLLQTLDQQIQQCTNHDDLARLVSRRAIHLARLNHLDEAKAEIARLRAELGMELGAGTGAWIFLAEGVIEYFKFDMTMAFDRLQRSYALAKATNQREASAIIASWLAHIAAEQGNIDIALTHISATLDVVGTENHPALSRISQTVGMLLGDANLLQESQKWFSRARLHATEEGDESALAALLYNKTLHRVVNAMLADALGQAQPVDFDLLVMEVESSNTLDVAFGGIGLRGNTDMIRGHLLSVRKNFIEAISTLRRIKADDVYSVHQAAIHSDLSYCLQAIGDQAGADEELGLALANIDNTNGADDLAFIHGRISQVKSMRGDQPSSAENLSRAKEFESKYRTGQLELAKRLTGIRAADSNFT